MGLPGLARVGWAELEWCGVGWAWGEVVSGSCMAGWLTGSIFMRSDNNVYCVLQPLHAWPPGLPWAVLCWAGLSLAVLRWDGMGWGGLGWAGLDWAWLGWAGMGWSWLGGLGWTGLGWAVAGLVRAKPGRVLG